jgi:hypothetical protein
MFRLSPTYIQALLWPAPAVPPMVAAVFSDPTGRKETFQQLIDPTPTNPELGTFSQHYWWNSTFWGGPSSPVSII